MSGVLVTQGVALFLTLGAIAAALGAVTTRALFASVMYLIVIGALAGAAILTLGLGDAALALLLIAIGIAPALLLGAVLLTARAARPRRGFAPWFSVAAVAAITVSLGWGASDLGLVASPTRALSEGAIAPWIAPLIFAASIACLGLLGYGERGVLESRPEAGR